ncbi:MAG: dTDP-4-dehydrorhamnose reductase [Sedimentisphaerales bacterium]|nr:dTDP-4-dehydrorhamnose reductase [Sedimentisphaerales bacterium]
MKNPVLVVGATGMLGTEVVALLKQRGRQVVEAVWPGDDDPEHHDLDITITENVEKLLEQVTPAVVINCSAYTNVDSAEEEEELATAVNGTGVGNLARASKKMNSLLVHVSTDYVFDGRGQSPYQTDTPTHPQSAYGRSKLSGEEAIQSIGGRWIIVRTSWLFGRMGKNFIDTILNLARQRPELKVVNDQRGCPTYATDLARCLIDLADKDAQGLFHFCNGPACTWYDFAQEAVELKGIDCRINPCSTDEFPRPAPRPAYSVMDCSKTFEQLGWQSQTWMQALRNYLDTD